jgi:hypothetical protein
LAPGQPAGLFVSALLLSLVLPAVPSAAAAESSLTAAGQIPTALIELDGTDSENPNGGDLQYEWTQIEGPKVELSDPTAVKPYFRTGRPGLYRFQLVVAANGLRSEPFIVELMIERENQPPVASSPREIRGEVGRRLEIDGRDSYDPDGGGLTYRWRPLGRNLAIPPAALSQPVLSFIPEEDGVFEIELVVSDSEAASEPSVTRLFISPKPKPPVARARANPKEIPSAPPPVRSMVPPESGAKPTARIEGPAAIRMGETAMLDARGSRGESNARLEYFWRQKSGPFIKDYELVFDGAAERFRPPKAGDYEFELVVADGSRESDPVVHALRVVNEPDPPVAVVVAPSRARPGALIRMDATQSYDLAGSPLTYLWRQTGGPRVTDYVIDEKLGDAAPAFHPASAGIYSFELIVSNGALRSRPAEITIEVRDARQAPALAVKGPEVATAGESLSLTIAARDTGGAMLAFAWRQAEGPAQALSPTHGIRAVAVPPVPGRYVFDVSALKEGRVVATARHAVEVFAPAGQTGIPAYPQPHPFRGAAAASSARPAAQIHPSTLGGTGLPDSHPDIFSALEPLAPLE